MPDNLTNANMGFLPLSAFHGDALELGILHHECVMFGTELLRWNDRHADVTYRILLDAPPRWWRIERLVGHEWVREDQLTYPNLRYAGDVDNPLPHHVGVRSGDDGEPYYNVNMSDLLHRERERVLVLFLLETVSRSLLGYAACTGGKQ